MGKREILSWSSVCTIALLVGCAADSTPSGSSPAGTTVGCVAGAVGCPPAGTAAGAAGANGTVTGSPGNAGRSPTGGVAGTGTVGPAPVASGVPCDVAQVVSNRCTGCHQSPVKFGAPMSLMTLADFQAPAKSNATRKVFQVIPERISPADPTKVMPPTSTTPLTAVDNQTITKWVTAGAMASANSCPITAADIVNNPNNTKTDAGTGPLPTGGHMGGASIDPIEYNDPEMKCYKFLAHAPGGTGPYSKSPGEQYMGFDFKAPWQGTQYQRAIKLAIDPNSQVIHHWLFFKQSAAVQDGAVNAGSGTHPDGILLHGWAPGASPLYLDPDVGVQLESTVGYQLEIHYNNATGLPGNDQSGAELCVTPKVPAHIAELAWVGTDAIAGTSATGTCSPNGPFPIHIIAAQPHMHLSGNHMKVTINRVGGKQEVIHDQPFMFENQRYYVEDVVLNQGDTMTTTCSYSAPATFGPSTSSEMCYFFSLHWPAGALRSAGIGTIIHGADSCL